MVKKGILREQFAFLGVEDVSDEVLEKCIDICFAQAIEEEELVEIWMAYSVSRLGGAAPTVAGLKQMERREFKKRDQPVQLQATKAPPDLVIYGKEASSSLDTDFDDDILDAYNSTPKAKNKFVKSRDHTPDSRPVQGRSPRAIFSPASYSPTVFYDLISKFIKPGGHLVDISGTTNSYNLEDTWWASVELAEDDGKAIKISTPSSKYKGRTNKGTVLCSLGDAWTCSWKRKDGDRLVPEVKLVELHMPADTRYMFTHLRDMPVILEEAIALLGEDIVRRNSLAQPEQVDLKHQEEFVAVGRIVSDSIGRLTSRTLLLESFLGRKVSLDVSQVETYSLFPGQVVAVEGENPTGNKISAKRVYCDASLPPPAPLPDMSTIEVVVATGPFTQTDSMTYQPLEDLMDYVEENHPHLLVLIGPFLDVSHPHIVEGLLAETYQDCFQSIVDGIMERMQKLKTQVVFVPSWRDAHHHMVYPAPPFVLKKRYPNLTLASDPCTIDVSGVIISATSTDILLHLGKEEISQVKVGSDRLGRIASHVLYQRNMYPLYPPVEEVNVDLNLWEKYAFLKCTPHILILPSDLRCFLKDLNGTVIVNTERLAKGVVGGNFARLQISTSGDRLSTVGQVVKI